MVKPTYSTDLSDTQWELIEDLFPEQVAYPNLRNDFYSFRSIVNAILYRLRTGVQYRLLPHEYPPFRRVNEWHLRWARTGLWNRILDRLRAAERARTPHASGRMRADPRLAIIDSQSVKMTEEAAASSGYDGGKKLKVANGTSWLMLSACCWPWC